MPGQVGCSDQAGVVAEVRQLDLSRGTEAAAGEGAAPITTAGIGIPWPYFPT